MKPKAIVYLFLFSVPALLGNLRAKDNDSYSKEDPPILDELYMPVLLPGGDVVIREMPVLFPARGRGANATLAELLSSPFYAASTNTAERKRNLNLISVANIRIRIRPSKHSDGFDRGAELEAVIDVSRFSMPKGAKIDFYGLIQAVLVCLRVKFPAGSTGRMEVRIAGARDKSIVAPLEGPLWRSGYLKSQSE